MKNRLFVILAAIALSAAMALTFTTTSGCLPSDGVPCPEAY